MCAYLHERGFENDAIFRGTRLQWEQLLGEHRYLSLEQVSRLERRAVALTGTPGWAWKSAPPPRCPRTARWATR